MLGKVYYDMVAIVYKERAVLDFVFVSIVRIAANLYVSLLVSYSFTCSGMDGKRNVIN